MSKDEEESFFEDFLRKLKETDDYRTLLATLLPLVEHIKASKSAQEFLKSSSEEIIARSERMQKRYDILKPSLKQKPTDESDTLQKALFYLGFFEVSVTNLVDTILMIFMANHHDFYLYRDRGYACKFKDLDDAFLGEKLTFLHSHGLEIFGKNLNHELRNKIAHMDFEITPDGIITVGKKKYNLIHETVKLAAFIWIVETAIWESRFPELLNALRR